VDHVESTSACQEARTDCESRAEDFCPASAAATAEVALASFWSALMDQDNAVVAAKLHIRGRIDEIRQVDVSFCELENPVCSELLLIISGRWRLFPQEHNLLKFEEWIQGRSRRASQNSIFSVEKRAVRPARRIR
jgi:hypothetical protein